MDDKIREVMLVLQAISIVSCCFVCFVYCYFQELRRRFAFRLVFWISLMDLGHALGYFIPEHPDAECQAEAYVTSYFSLAAALRTANLAYFLYHPVNQSERVLEFWFSLFANGIPLCVLAIPKGRLGPSEGWCWIRIDGDNFQIGTILRFVTFYGPLWLVITYNSLTYWRIRRRIQREEQYSQLPLVDAHLLVKRLRWYPWILALCYTVPTVNRLYETFSFGRTNVWLSLISGITLSLCGLGNAIAYGLTDTVIEQLTGRIG